MRNSPEDLSFGFPSECLIKSLINLRNVTKMETTFGTWMKDTAHLNDERIWVAEHFSGRLLTKLVQILSVPSSLSFTGFSSEHLLCSSSGRVVKEYRSISSFQNSSGDTVDIRKFYQGCGHAVHNGSFYYHVAGTPSIAR